MRKKLYSVTVRGKCHEWNFNFYSKEKYLQDWLDDNLEVCEIENSIPIWLPPWIPLRFWCFLQDLFYFKNPLRNK